MTTQRALVLTRHSLDQLYTRVLRRQNPMLPLDPPDDKTEIKERAREMIDRAERSGEIYKELSPWLQYCHRHQPGDQYIAKLDRESRATFIIKRKENEDIVLTAFWAVCRSCVREDCHHIRDARKRLRGRVPNFFMLEG